MNAGPMNGSSARMPRRSPANAWRASSSVRPATVSIANEHLPGKAEGDLPEPAAEANRDRTFVAAGLEHLDVGAELETELADRAQLVGDSFAPLSQLGAPIAVMADEAECGQLAEHLAHGRGGNMEVLGQF